MCEPVSSYDSRGGGWHCCGPNGKSCNAFNSEERPACWSCGRRRHAAAEPPVQMELSKVSER
jgi:hypothetical protein